MNEKYSVNHNRKNSSAWLIPLATGNLLFLIAAVLILSGNAVWLIALLLFVLGTGAGALVSQPDLRAALVRRLVGPARALALAPVITAPEPTRVVEPSESREPEIVTAAAAETYAQAPIANTSETREPIVVPTSEGRFWFGRQNGRLMLRIRDIGQYREVRIGIALPGAPDNEPGPANPITQVTAATRPGLRPAWVKLGLLTGAIALILVWFAQDALDQHGISATEKAARATPVIEEFTLNGETIKISHPRLDMGEVKNLFDHDTSTLVRGLEANPFVLDFEFPQAKAIKGLALDFGGMDFALRVQVYGAEGGNPVRYQGEYRRQPPVPHVDMSFANGPAQVKRIYIEIEQLNPPLEPHIHVREVDFKE